MTTTVSHTRGPWKIATLFENGCYAYYLENTQGGELPDEAEANARLIAAAPELLACLKEALELIQEDIDNRDGRDNFGMCCGRCDGAIPVEHSFGCRAKAAISKAETGQ